MASRGVHDHGVKTVQPRDGKVVTGLDVILIDVNLSLVLWSLNEREVDSPLEEFFIGILHVFRHFWLE